MPTYELEQSTCEKEGVDSRGILAFIRRLKERDIHLHTFTMARHGKLIAQVNAFPYKNTCRHVENSVTKTFTCVAVGLSLIHICCRMTRQGRWASGEMIRMLR